ncbi:MAG: succinate dehydrogenase, cytochrome b556 subunit [Gammaproteobacteria bacterium]|nr:succinate dehydrogenase, cytochrome b556 subunit [Gammaproteobacteria bacterium]
MANTNRPLSPHLQVYRWQLTMALSIVHRGTGIALCAGIPFLLYWIRSLTSGEAGYYEAQAFFASAFGQLVLLVLSASLFYHLCNGIRHLYWDLARGLDLPAVYRSGRLVLVATGALTVIAWIAAYLAPGGGA